MFLRNWLTRLTPHSSHKLNSNIYILLDHDNLLMIRLQYNLAVQTMDKSYILLLINKITF